jgi:hypothetical protein
MLVFDRALPTFGLDGLRVVAMGWVIPKFQMLLGGVHCLHVCFITTHTIMHADPRNCELDDDVLDMIPTTAAG